MGCVTSKLDNEFMVRRCKERCRLVEDAVYARRILAAAHFDYCRSLRITGSALFTFAQNEPFSVSDQTPAMFLRSITPVPPSIPSLQPPPPPPPPLPPLSPSCTPSQTTSVWNWENFYPPSPPDSEFFQQRAQNNNLDDDDIDEEEGNREDAESRSEIRTRLNFGSSVHAESVVNEPRFEGSSESEKWEDARSSRSHRTSEIEEMKEELRHKDLKEIVEAIRENFDMAAASGEQVSEMLEIGREQLDHSFRQLKKTVYHSSSMLSRSSSSWTSNPLLAVKYQLDASLLDEPGGPKSLCSTLERLWAWEKKLYAEVKAKEGLKIEREKKLLALQSQEYKEEDEAKLDKTRASIKRLQSQIIVSSQAVSTTSTTILNLGDTDLIPQLVDMCHGFMCMWRSMHQYHEAQSNIVQQVRGLVNWSVKSDSTSELHRQATCDLESAVSAWHSSFCRLIKFQRDFIRSIQGWFKLILLPVDDDNINGNSEPSRVYAFLDEWKLVLDRVPHTFASEAIKSFINVVRMISVQQNEDYKIKKRTETASKELERKASSLRNMERKFYHSYSMVGLGPPDSGHDNGHALYPRDQLAKKKSEFAASQRRVEEEMLNHSKAVEETRAMTLHNLQMGLPGVFFALTNFSAFLAEALESVCTSSNAIN